MRDAGIVKGDIDSTVALPNMLGEAANLRGLSQIGPKKLDAQLPGDDLSAIAVNIREHDGGTIVLQGSRSLQADSAGSPGNDRDAVLQAVARVVSHRCSRVRKDKRAGG